MPTYKRADESVKELAEKVLRRFETHEPILNAEVKIDFVFAFPDNDKNGLARNEAIKFRGRKALGLCRILKLKDRVMGRGDAEILLDGDWWDQANEKERAALLDHELHHIIPVDGETDDIDRPKLLMRPHDVDVGWFSLVAHRNGEFSQEQQQAKQIMDAVGQYYWPELAPEPIVKLEEKSNVSNVRRAAAKLRKRMDAGEVTVSVNGEVIP